MPLTVYGIYRARVQFKNCEDARPWIILSFAEESEAIPHDLLVLAAPLSSQLDLFDGRRHLLVEKSCADFPATGLLRSSYVIGDFAKTIPVAAIEKKFGELTGDLLLRFKAWESGR